ncbi:MAG: histidine--tRNA ligase [Bacteroidetes bacterium GWF2_42_66]|nr:MAG: histidine--tRNA ligase [Bacteroidetes bacterium GWA2_42_15]OFX97472.1 MAG: histidine--tRNA ligase [Bacteroidetes bacterium GWE2_42_39]OFY43833.1 MAG: histidine--tRNA ligase [Bacteroidetes bacterium GWF2_42_66]HBL76180.1 histidine--tRNA ligase [Prolixibacteraceae bacterium]HCR91959.1 histidine--tRNA ligase [Prolixibacteraceae bacterium]
MAQKPSIPKGTRDFSPAEMTRRNYIFDTIKSVFRLYGFQPIETPAMENLSTLMGKYGEEGDKLLFKVLNSGDFASDLSDNELLERNSVRLTNKISEKGLRYDLTVPFARFVVQYRNDISFPFKRYQIQPVWRADRPQKGRYREFFQCDVDIVGSDSLLNEAELVQIVDDVFGRLKINTLVKVNNRKILAGIAETIGEKERIVDITVAIDKLDKIGLEKVNEELLEKGISQAAVGKLQPILHLSGNTAEKLDQLTTAIAGSEIGQKGIDEVRTLFAYLESFELNTEVELDLTLARGLNYYTGAIFEVKAKDVAMGSICGGGRYDDLTGIFGMPGVSGVGISFGADRIYDVMTQLDLFPQETIDSTKILFVNFGEKEEAYCLPIVSKLRKAGINAEIFPDQSKMKKQMTWANQKNIPFVALVGEQEMEQGKINLKNMITGDQQLVDVAEMIKILSV